MMLTSIIKSLFLSVSLTLSMAVYQYMDYRFHLTRKISHRLRIPRRWQPFLIMCCSITFAIVFGMAGIYMLDLSETSYYITCGVLFGFTLSFSNQMHRQLKRR